MEFFSDGPKVDLPPSRDAYHIMLNEINNEHSYASS